MKTTALEALNRLREGNRQFAVGERTVDSLTDGARRLRVARRQDPCAIILGCSDSRVPAELIFGQGLGDLFVIRVAGNIVAPSQVGSVEYAAERFGARLVVVLGHARCGAVSATLDELEKPYGLISPNLIAIVNRIRPSIAPLLELDPKPDRAELIDIGVRANIRRSADLLRNGSQILEDQIRDRGMLVVGAQYSLESGLVEFFDGVPECRADS